MLLPHYRCNRNEYCGNLHVYNYIDYRFLKEVTRNGNKKLLQNYLELHLDYSHLLAVLQHDRRDETDDIAMWWERGNWLCVFIQVFLEVLMSGTCPFLHCTAAVWFRVANERFTGQGLFHQLMEAHSHFSLTTGRPVVLDIAVHFHCSDSW